MTRRTTILAALLAVVLVAAIAIAAVTSRNDDKAGSDQPAPASEGVPSGLEEFYTQKLSWDDCGEAQCTTVEVPIDYEKPDGDTLKLEVKVIPAKGDGGRSLFVNPGGPGGEAQRLRRLHGGAARRRRARPLRHRRCRPAGCRQEHAGRLPVRPRARRLRGERARSRQPGRDQGVPGHRRRLRQRVREAVRSTGLAHLHRGGGPRLRHRAGAARRPRRSTGSARPTAPSSAPPTPPCSPRRSAAWCSTARSTRR